MRWMPITLFEQTKWHEWFAWKPVEVYLGDDEEGNFQGWAWVWWEVVERKRGDPWRASPFSYKLIPKGEHNALEA